MRGNRLELRPNEKHGMLTYIGDADKVYLPCGQSNRMVRVLCDCGKETVIRLLHFVRDRQHSCGCLAPEQHGMVGTKLHNAWRGMLNRCRNDNYIDHHRYKDRGITFCNEWSDFLYFKNWAINNGYKEGLQLDRINNNGGYYPENCRFVTPSENVANREVTLKVSYKGRNVALAQLISEFGISDRYHLIHHRISRGWNAERAIDTPPRKGNYRRKNAVSAG